MKTKWLLPSILSAIPLLAHHSPMAEYDLKKKTTIQGTVTKVEWQNPHAKFYIDALGSDGTTAHWTIEVGSPNGLMQLGWNKNTIKQGDPISVVVLAAKDGSQKGFGQTFTLANGRVFSAPGKTLTYPDGAAVIAWDHDLAVVVCEQYPNSCVASQPAEKK